MITVEFKDGTVATTEERPGSRRWTIECRGTHKELLHRLEDLSLDEELAGTLSGYFPTEEDRRVAPAVAVCPGRIIDQDEPPPLPPGAIASPSA